MGRKRKKVKQYKVNVPTPVQNAQGYVPSSNVENLRQEYNQQYSILQQQADAQRQAYESQILGVQTQQQGYAAQQAAADTSLRAQYEAQTQLLQQQLAGQAQQYSLLQQQYTTAQEQSARMAEQQRANYEKLMAEQQEQAQRQQEASRRALAEQEQAQAGVGTDAMALAMLPTAQRRQTAAPLVPAANVTRGSSPTPSLLRR